MAFDTFGDDHVGEGDADRVDDDRRSDEDSEETPEDLPLEADEADVIEQSRAVPESEEDYPDS